MISPTAEILRWYSFSEAGSDVPAGVASDDDVVLAGGSGAADIAGTHPERVSVTMKMSRSPNFVYGISGFPFSYDLPALYHNNIKR